jgi:hypothetical protein
LCRTDAAGLTLQSGQAVEVNQLVEAYPNQCCIPRSAINDFTPILRIDNSNGNCFVSNDQNCNTFIPSESFPATFEYIYVCGQQCPPGGCNTEVVEQINGGEGTP